MRITCLIVSENISVAGGLDKNETPTYLLVYDRGGEDEDRMTVRTSTPGGEEPGPLSCARHMDSVTRATRDVEGDFTVVDS